MRPKRAIVALLIFISFALVGCGAKTGLKEYQPKSPEEKEVTTFFIECLEAHQSGNREAFLSCFNEKAIIKLNYPRPEADPLVSKSRAKEEYERIDFKTLILDLVEPEIIITGNEAIIKGYEQYKPVEAPVNVTIYYNFNLVRENDRWSIMKWDWRVTY